MSETLAKKIKEISRKLNKLEAIEEKVKMLDSIEQKIESFSSKLSDMKKALRSELNSLSEAQGKLMI